MEEAITSETLNDFRRKVENPYTIVNMQMALDSIRKKMAVGKLKTATGEKAAIPNKENIKPNVLYIQFTPKTFEQEGLLKKDSTLALVDYPLGYEYDDEWFKKRPKLNKDEIPDYYTSVHVDRELPKGVPHKVLAEMYLPQQDESLEGSRAMLYRTANNEVGDFVDILLHQAFKQTNNAGLDGLGILKKAGESQSKFLGIGIGEKWHPEGTLRIWDDQIGSTRTTRRIFDGYETYPCDTTLEPIARNEVTTNYVIQPIDECTRAKYRYEFDDTPGSYVPLEGAQVLLRDTFTIGNEITNSAGYFSFDELRGEKRYIIQWERFHYSIRNGSLFQAETRDPKQNRRWNHDVKGGDDEYHGMIHLAAYDYYYGSRFGLTSSPTNATLQKQMKIAARESAPWGWDSSYSHIRGDMSLGIAAQIHIKAWQKSSDKIYGTTIHELAHAAHSVVDRSSYDDIVRDAWISFWESGTVINNNRRLLETWARTVEIVFALKRYNTDAGNPDYEYYVNENGYEYRNFQFLTIAQENHYTSAGYDMIDDIDQSTVYDIRYPQDRVFGYNIKQLEDALVGAKSWWHWRDNIKSKYNNPTEIHIDELFNNWPN